jgi:hypothetical protein
MTRQTTQIDYNSSDQMMMRGGVEETMVRSHKNDSFISFIFAMLLHDYLSTFYGMILFIFIVFVFGFSPVLSFLL